ncbi:hypothetical protein B0T17DRAFT_354736 [Bombardia bombarda]|uniref:Uncharacterized protein n=1 Tax=Bombardia bombarda TaxID=252184 RepID=A0AA40BW61_9PEZI|nr:hypothetical protein B0T17DRAFT_354736 [Bombardia bombarda]
MPRITPRLTAAASRIPLMVDIRSPKGGKGGGGKGGSRGGTTVIIYSGGGYGPNNNLAIPVWAIILITFGSLLLLYFLCALAHYYSKERKKKKQQQGEGRGISHGRVFLKAVKAALFVWVAAKLWKCVRGRRRRASGAKVGTYTKVDEGQDSTGDSAQLLGSAAAPAYGEGAAGYVTARKYEPMTHAGGDTGAPVAQGASMSLNSPPRIPVLVGEQHISSTPRIPTPRPAQLPLPSTRHKYTPRKLPSTIHSPQLHICRAICERGSGSVTMQTQRDCIV